MSTTDQTLIALGRYRLDVAGRQLTRDGTILPVGGRALEVLAALVAARGDIISKDALLAQVWPGLTVEENNLQVQISALRKVLGDGWIVTVSGRGYRLTVPSGDEEATLADAHTRDKPSIAVLPFANMSDDAEQDYFAEGMADEIITALSRVQSFVVIARNSSFTYRGRNVDVTRIGRDLSVRYVLDGSVRKGGRRVRIIGQLVDTQTGATVWADKFDGELEDVFDLQDRVAASVVGAIVPRIHALEFGRAQRKRPTDLRAYDLLLRASAYLPVTSEDGFETAQQLLQTAIKMDPTYARALAQLALSRWGGVSQGFKQQNEKEAAETVRLARLALAHGSDDPDVLAMVSTVIALSAGDLYGGIDLAEKALTLNPNSNRALVALAIFYAFAGDDERSFSYVERAERVNPFEGVIFRIFATVIAHFSAGRYAAALCATDRMLRENPQHAPALRYRAACLGLLGRTADARQAVHKLQTVQTELTVTRARAHLEIEMNSPFKAPGVIDAFCEGLKRAGVPG